MNNDSEMPDVTALVGRIRGLERGHRRLMALTILIALAFVWREANPAPNEVRSARFTLVDQTGRERGMWRVQDGVAALIIRDEQGNWRAMMAVGGEGTSVNGARLEVNGTGHDESMAALTTEQGIPALRIWEDRAGDPHVRIESHEDDPVIEMEDSTGRFARLRPRAQDAGREESR